MLVNFTRCIYVQTEREWNMHKSRFVLEKLGWSETDEIFFYSDNDDDHDLYVWDEGKHFWDYVCKEKLPVPFDERLGHSFQNEDWHSLWYPFASTIVECFERNDLDDLQWFIDNIPDSETYLFEEFPLIFSDIIEQRTLSFTLFRLTAEVVGPEYMKSGFMYLTKETFQHYQNDIMVWIMDCPKLVETLTSGQLEIVRPELRKREINQVQDWRNWLWTFDNNLIDIIFTVLVDQTELWLK